MTRLGCSWVLLSFLTVGSLWGQGRDCAPDLTNALYYPSEVLRNPIQGFVSCTVVWESGADSSVVRCSGYPGLRSSVEEVLRSAEFGRECAAESVVNVRFEISDSVHPNSKSLVTRLSHTSYEVIAPDLPVIANIADPAWLFSWRGRAMHRIARGFSKLRTWLYPHRKH